jgi:uncharacterized small protein (DUF1192 family)
MIGEIDENVAVLQGHRKQLEAQIKGGDNRREVKDLRDRIVHMISVLSQKEISQEDRIRALQSGIGRTRLTATTAFGGNVLGEPVNPPATAFLDGVPMQRRTAATLLGNAAALATMTLYMANYVLPLAAQALAVTDPDDAIGFNATEFNSTLANATLTDSMHNGGGFNSVLMGATNGCVLIGSWLMRRAIATGAEYALAMGEGLRRRLVQKKPVEAQQPEDAGILLERRV